MSPREKERPVILPHTPPRLHIRLMSIVGGLCGVPRLLLRMDTPASHVRSAHPNDARGGCVACRQQKPLRTALLGGEA
jgi:hypothetical protein